MKSKDQLVLIGYGGHAKSIADCVIRQGGYTLQGYTDIVERHTNLNYLGSDDVLQEQYNGGIRNAVIGLGFVGNSSNRVKLVQMAKEIGFVFPVIKDPSAVVSADSKIGDGTFIGKMAVVNAGTEIGEFCIINTGAIVEHDNQIGSGTHIAVGARLCGNVKVGKNTLIGAGATVIQGINIGDNVIIGAGSVVVKDIPSNVKAYGNPCKVVEK